MTATERKYELMRILRVRRHEIIANLAHELKVSKRTIQNDISILSLYEPIYTVAGRYGGGVYYLEDAASRVRVLSNDEAVMLERVLMHVLALDNDAFTPQDRKEMISLLHSIR